MNVHSDRPPTARTQATSAASISATNNTPSVSSLKKVSFAAMVSKDRGPTKAVFADIRHATERRVCMEQDAPYPVRFTKLKNEHCLALPKSFAEIPHKDLLSQIAVTFPKMALFIDWEKDDYHIGFKSSEDLKEALDTPLVVNNYTVPTFPALYSPGHRLQIRADFLGCSSIAERQEELKELFKPFGNIVHFQFFYFTNSDGLMGSMEFILDIPLSSSRDLMLPRVKYLFGYNAMFSWAGNPFCFRCGSSDHTKVECPRPHSYSIADDLPFDKPLMARAFPDLEAYSRQSQHPRPQSKDEWTIVGTNNKRDRSTRNKSNESGSENDTSGSSPTQSRTSKKTMNESKATKPAMDKTPKKKIASPAAVKEHGKQMSAGVLAVTKTTNPPTPTPRTTDNKEKKSEKKPAETIKAGTDSETVSETGSTLQQEEKSINTDNTTTKSGTWEEKEEEGETEDMEVDQDMMELDQVMKEVEESRDETLTDEKIERLHSRYCKGA
ncbi:hypothetical protein BGX33_011123, partial [Mortierella sp. NVP41]